MSLRPKVTTLVLDAGPLLSLVPLNGLADHYVTVPQILEELKDNKAREHFKKLGLISGVKVELRNPDTAALTQVISAAKKTGDYSVLSKPDLSILALTYALNEEWKARETSKKSYEKSSSPQASSPESSVDENLQDVQAQLTNLSVESDSQTEKDQSVTSTAEVESDATSESDSTPFFEDPPSEDDGEGKWITPDNVALHKSRALDLIPSEMTSTTKKMINEEQQFTPVGCMTADFAMQNVLLHMGLHLVGIEGKRINQLKTWVLRCHACFKICKDSSKKFCPSCGNPTLLRTSVTISAPTTPGGEPTMQIHLKKNFQYRNRGTKYSIPLPKPGSSKTGTGVGLVLRADQPEWLRAEKWTENQRRREEKKVLNAVGTSTSTGVKMDWMDPDWLPEMLATGTGGKGRTIGKDGMPTIGHGRRNPNERRRRK